MDQVGERLWLGDWADGNSHRRLKNHGVDALLSLTNKRRPPHFEDFFCAHVPLRDADDVDIDMVTAAIIVLRRMLSDGWTVLVHCQVGASRSASVVAGHLACEDGLTLDRAMASLAKKRKKVNPNSPVLRAMKRQLDIDSLRGWLVGK